MKVLPIILLIMGGLFSVASGQSGRRVRNSEPTPTSTPQVQVTQDVRDVAPEVGYSESATNAPRSISARQREAKKAKKDAKKQAKPTQTTTPTTPAPTDSDEEIIKVETSLITIPVAVYDRNGFYVPSLSKDSFKIFEDGAEQEIAYFGRSEKPFTVVLLLDVSPSTEYKIDEIQSAAIAFVDQLKPQDNVMVVQFDERVSVLAELTNDRQKLYQAIRRANFGGGTALYEAVDFSLRRKLNKIEGRKAIVLFTDGVDTASTGATFEGTVEDAEESEATIFPIYYNTFLSMRGIGTGGVMNTPATLGIPPVFGGGGQQPNGSTSAEYTRGRAYLNELASATGGRVFRPESTNGGLTAAFEGIAEELRSEYNIGYYPQVEGESGQRKQIKVRVNRPKLVVRARDSYIVGANENSGD